MILHSFLGDSSTAKVLVCASFCGVEVAVNLIKLQDLKTKEFKKKFLLQKMPVLEINEENTIVESSAMVRHLARKSLATAYGSTHYQQALTDQWLDLAENELEPAALALTAILQGHVKFDKNAQKLAQDDFMKVCSYLNGQLEKTKFLTGESPTVADYATFTTLAQVLRCAVPGSAISKLAKLKEWTDILIKDKHVIAGMGKITFCTKPFAVPPAEEEE
jgi:glutathione S-transferase